MDPTRRLINIHEPDASAEATLHALTQDDVQEPRDAGEALETALAEDRAWRVQRDRTMQHRLNETVSLGKQGHRLRNWAWGLAFGGVFLFVFTLPAAYEMNSSSPSIKALQVMCLSGFVLSLIGLLLLPASKLLRGIAILWRRLLLRQAKLDSMDVQDPARTPRPGPQ